MDFTCPGLEDVELEELRIPSVIKTKQSRMQCLLTCMKALWDKKCTVTTL
jgi:hypothetical protein